jgi:hypothetical protein
MVRVKKKQQSAGLGHNDGYVDQEKNRTFR